MAFQFNHKPRQTGETLQVCKNAIALMDQGKEVTLLMAHENQFNKYQVKFEILHYPIGFQKIITPAKNVRNVRWDDNNLPEIYYEIEPEKFHGYKIWKKVPVQKTNDPVEETMYSAQEDRFDQEADELNRWENKRR